MKHTCQGHTTAVQKTFGPHPFKLSCPQQKKREGVFLHAPNARRASPPCLGEWVPCSLNPLWKAFRAVKAPSFCALSTAARSPLTTDTTTLPHQQEHAHTRVLYVQGLEVSGGLRTRRLGGGRAARGRTCSQAPHTDHCDNNTRHKRQPNEHWMASAHSRFNSLVQSFQSRKSEFVS